MKLSEIQVTPIHPERWGDDLDVVNAARVSFNRESGWLTVPCDTCSGTCFSSTEGKGCWQATQTLSDKDAKLINYLAKHKHFSPFNHSFLSFRIKAPIFVARQLV